MKKFLTAVAASLLFVASSAFAVPTAQQIEQAMSQGNWQKADAGLSEVLQAHPNNAHAHYLYAQVLDREGRYDDALSHLRQAKSLDPQLKFTDPMRFAATEARIRGDANRANVVANVPGAGQQANQTGSVAQKPSFNPAPAQEKHGPSIGSWVGIAVLFAAIALVLRWGLRRARARDDGRANDDRRTQLKRATELLNDVRTLKLDVRLSTTPGHEALLKDVEGVEAQLRELVEALSNAKNPVPPYQVEDLANRVESLKARAEGRPDPNAAPASTRESDSVYAQEAERFGRNRQGPYPPQQPYPQQQGPVIIQQGGGGFGGGMGGLLTGVLLGEALSHGRDRVVERQVPTPDNNAGNGGSDGGDLDFGNGSNDWNDGGGGGGLDLGNNDDNWRDT
ncbi:Tetratricopeptide repeat-containing protein [Caballeronia arationis]|uniref:Tetratricopeptide repeat-containing protein n=1 Tax=Caballeronia arationis TaxID=1777142 RepID=A0A7Z7IA44_9BURK|nr:tetratricopeptide repeat protein [Caballeronia arationis]SOE81561.1 Tetratricopeptide repeat-containing protein [Caballeronia arationis]